MQSHTRIAVSLILGLAMIVVGDASAATIYVPDNIPTIQQAIMYASNGDTIIVKRGAYVEQLDFRGKAITVKSEEGASVTIINGGGKPGYVISFKMSEGVNTILAGFTITGGASSAIYCSNSSPTIENNIIGANLSNTDGAGISIQSSSSPTIKNNTIVSNIVNTNFVGGGGAIFCGGSSSPKIYGNYIANNSAVGASAYGGAFHCDNGSNPEIYDNLIYDNRAEKTGGAVYVDYSGTIDLHDNIIEDNSGLDGGAIYCSNNSTADIYDNLISSNHALTGHGGGIYCSSSANVVATNNIFDGNSANTSGGAVYCGSGTELNLTSNVIRNNSSGGPGGGLILDASDKLDAVWNNLFYNNFAATDGGALSCNEARLVADAIQQNTFYGNTAAVSGGAIYISGGSVFLMNCILWANQAFTGNEGAIENTPNVTITNCDILGGQSSFDIAPGGWFNWDASNIDADPRFVDPYDGDFHLMYDSPCRELGRRPYVNWPDYDFEGDPRIVHSTQDSGADEFYWHLYSKGPIRPGVAFDLVVIGLPNRAVTLLMSTSNTIKDPPLSTPYGNLHLQPPLNHTFLGFTDKQTGLMIHTVTAPTSWVSGEEYLRQALIGRPGYPDTSLTNLEVLVVE